MNRKSSYDLPVENRGIIQPMEQKDLKSKTLMDRMEGAQIDHSLIKKEPKKEDLLTNLNQERSQATLAEMSKRFHQYSMDKSRKIFMPDEYEQEIAGRVPTSSPLLAALHNSAQRTSYLTPLPALAYQRQIDVDSKYVREGQYIYGAQ